MEQRRTNRGRSSRRPSAAKNILLAVMFVFGLLAVVAGILSFSDIAGDTVLKMAADAVREQTGLLLSAEKISGNPILGYTITGVSLDNDAGQRRNVFAARSLAAKLNFMSLLRGSPKLSLLSVGGINMDLDRFTEELAAIKLPESSGGGEIPIDRITLTDSRFTSKWGAVDVNSVGADIDGTALNLGVDGAVNSVPIKGNIDADVHGKDVVVRKLELAVGKGRLTSAGNIGSGPEGEGGVSVDFQGSLKGLDVSEAALFWPTLSSSDYAGAADVDFTAEGAGSNLLITASLNFNGSKIGGYPLETLSSRLRYANMRLAAESVRATTLGIPIEGELAINMRAGVLPSIMIKLDGKNVPLSEAARLYPGLGSADGEIERFAVDIHGPTDALSGVVELSAPDVSIRGKRIRNAAVQVKLAKGDTASVSGKLALEGAQAYLQGTINGVKAFSSAGLDLTAKMIDLDVKKIEDLIPDGKSYGLSGLVTANLTIKGKAGAPVVGGTVTSPKFTAQGYTLDKPSLSFTYDKDTLTLRESSGSWSGLPIKASGSVGPLSSKTPNVDMTAQLSFSPETLKRFVPDADKYQLKGTVNAGVKITGKLPQPSVNLVASSQALSAFGAVSAKNLEVTTSLGGDLSKLDKVNLALKAGSIAAGGVGLQDLSAAVRKDGQQISLENASARSGGGSVTGGGTAALSGSDARLDFAFDLNQLDLAPLAQSGGLGVALAGRLSGRLEVKGQSSNPEISFKGQSPSVAAGGLTLAGVAADLSGNAKSLKINDLRASVGGAPLTAAGNISMADPFRADINISGGGLDLASLTEGVPDLKGQVSGKADFKFSVKSTAGGNSGSGSVTSPAVTFFGVKASDVTVPLALSGSTLKSEGGTLTLYGGKLTNTLTVDMKNMKFTDEINASGVDVNALAQDASGGLGGRITGNGSLSSFKINGSFGGAVTYSGSGKFAMGAGSVTGFSGLDILTRLYGVDGIRYVEITAPLRLETGRLIIGKGASMLPPQGDPIYKTASLAEDGAVTFDKKIYFVIDGNVNFQLINALLGGVAGGAEALLKGGQNLLSGAALESALRGALTGGRDQGQSADFRDVTAKVTGTSDSPSFALVKVAPGKQEAPAQTPAPTPAVPVPAAQPSAKPEEIIREKIIDAIIPQKPAQPAPAETPQAAQQPEAPQPAEKPVEEQIKEEVGKKIEDEVRKGLDNLFRRR